MHMLLGYVPVSARANMWEGAATSNVTPNPQRMEVPSKSRTQRIWHFATEGQRVSGGKVNNAW